MLAIHKTKTKAIEMEAASKIVFDDDEDLDIQAAAFQSCLLSLEAKPVKDCAMCAGELNCYASANSIIDSGAGANFVTSIDKISRPQCSSLNNAQKMGKNALLLISEKSTAHQQ